MQEVLQENKLTKAYNGREHKDEEVLIIAFEVGYIFFFRASYGLRVFSLSLGL